MFLYSHWLRLPVNTRHQLAVMFGIKKTGATEVANNEVVKDGYAIKDIEEALNIDALQKYLNTDETDFLVLWDWLISGAEGRVRTAQATVTVANEEAPILQPENGHGFVGAIPDTLLVADADKKTLDYLTPKKKRGRPFKKKP